MEETHEFRKIRWQCRRGMLELELFLVRFFDECYLGLEQSDREDFQKLLQQPDAILYHWLLGYEKPEDPSFEKILQKLRATTSWKA